MEQIRETRGEKKEEQRQSSATEYGGEDDRGSRYNNTLRLRARNGTLGSRRRDPREGRGVAAAIGTDGVCREPARSLGTESRPCCGPFLNGVVQGEEQNGPR